MRLSLVCTRGGGLMVTSLGCHLHALPLLYLGYGVLGGMGWGFGYISPVSTLIKWFPGNARVCVCVCECVCETEEQDM
jgi:hypothetical protein